MSRQLATILSLIAIGALLSATWVMKPHRQSDGLVADVGCHLRSRARRVYGCG